MEKFHMEKVELADIISPDLNAYLFISRRISHNTSRKRSAQTVPHHLPFFL